MTLDRTMSYPIFLPFLTLLILPRILDVYYFWEEVCTIDVSSKGKIISIISRILVICKKRDKNTFKNPIQETLNSITSNK